MSTSRLFTPYDLGTVQLRNRSILAPMTRVSAAPDGSATERMAEYYAAFAAGGFAAVITEGSYIDEAHSQTYLDQPGLATEKHAAAWKQVTDRVHAEGAVAIAQLQHSGPQSQGNSHASGLRAPSAVSARGEQLGMYRGSGPYSRPEALTSEEIADVQRSFAGAAVRAHEAGFDGVEIHGANGYLVDAFLTDYLNVREDEYGGSPAARVLFARQIVDAVRASVGSDFIVGIRISQAKVSDAHHKWTGVDEARVIFEALNDSGVDYIHTTEWRASAPAFPDKDERSLAALARAFAPQVTVIANGSINTGADADEILRSGQADLVSLGKAALGNRDWPNAVQAGRPVEAPLYPSAFGELATIQDWELTETARAF